MTNPSTGTPTEDHTIKLHADTMNVKQYILFTGTVLLLLGGLLLLSSKLLPAYLITPDDYRTYVFVVKLILLTISITGYYMYSNRISNLRSAFRCQEHKALQMLVPFLLVINEPISYRIFDGNIFSWIIITLFVIFSTLLVRLWLVITDDLSGSETALTDTMSRPAKLYAALYFAVVWVTYISYHSDVLNSPTFDFDPKSEVFTNAQKVVLYLTLAVGFLWIVWKTVRSLRRIGASQGRERYFFWFSFFFMIIQSYIVSRGGLYPFNHHDTESILYSGIFTLYVLSACYLYKPTQEGVQEANRQQKYENPVAKSHYADLEDDDDTDTSTSTIEQAISSGAKEKVVIELNDQPNYPYYAHKSDDE